MPFEVAVTVKGNVPLGVGPGLILEPPHETRLTTRARAMKCGSRCLCKAHAMIKRTAANGHQRLRGAFSLADAGAVVVTVTKRSGERAGPFEKINVLVGLSLQDAPGGIPVQVTAAVPANGVGAGGLGTVVMIR